MVPESEEVRREHWRRGDFRHLLPSHQWLASLFKRASHWCWDNYTILLIFCFVGGPIITWGWTQLKPRPKATLLWQNVYRSGDEREMD